MIDAKRFSDAIWAGELRAVEEMISGGVDVNISDDERQPPIHLAIEQNHAEIVRRLIAAGAEINRDSGEGWTPLVHAIDIESDAAWQKHHETGHESTELTELLLARGAIPTARAFDVANAYSNHRALTLLERANLLCK